MENKEDGGLAFPITATEHISLEKGMTLRDYFAAKAMQTLVMAIEKESDIVGIPTAAYGMADLMLKERKK